MFACQELLADIYIIIKRIRLWKRFIYQMDKPVI
jgi:hypothetical protein